MVIRSVYARKCLLQGVHVSIVNLWFGSGMRKYRDAMRYRTVGRPLKRRALQYGWAVVRTKTTTTIVPASAHSLLEGLR